MTLADFFSILVSSLLGSGLLLLFVKIGLEKWVNTTFDKKLEDYKNAQAQELEKLRQSLSVLSARLSRVHEKEFETLPELPVRVNDVLNWLTALIQSVNQILPDPTKMTEYDLATWQNSLLLGKADEMKLLTSPRAEQREIYRGMLFKRSLDGANKALFDLHQFVSNKRLFLGGLQPAVFEIQEELQKAIINVEIAFSNKRPWSDEVRWRHVNELARNLSDKLREKLIESETPPAPSD